MGLLSLLFGCGTKESPFQQRNGAWYYNSAPIPESDAKSFAVLSEHYAKDKNRVYYGELSEAVMPRMPDRCIFRAGS